MDICLDAVSSCFCRLLKGQHSILTIKCRKTSMCPNFHFSPLPKEAKRCWKNSQGLGRNPNVPRHYLNLPFREGRGKPIRKGSTEYFERREKASFLKEKSRWGSSTLLR